MGGRWRFSLGGGAAGLYAASLVLPTASPFGGTVYPGWDAFRVGWRAVWVFEPDEGAWWALSGAWVANPLVWAALAALFLRRRRACQIAAAAAALLCLPVLGWYGNMVIRHPGYWAWVASAVVLCGASRPRWAASTSDLSPGQTA